MYGGGFVYEEDKLKQEPIVADDPAKLAALFFSLFSYYRFMPIV